MVVQYRKAAECRPGRPRAARNRRSSESVDRKDTSRRPRRVCAEVQASDQTRVLPRETDWCLRNTIRNNEKNVTQRETRIKSYIHAHTLIVRYNTIVVHSRTEREHLKSLPTAICMQPAACIASQNKTTR